MDLDLVARVRRLVSLASSLYEWYVPPFEVATTQLSESDLRSVVGDVYSKSRPATWLRLDGTYYTTDLDTWRKIIEWDWSDTRRYVIDRFDCNSFAMYFKTRVALDFGLNAVAVVLDYSAGHAYNIIVFYSKSASRFSWLLYEPQTDALFRFEERDRSLYGMEPGGWVLLL